MVAPGAFVVPVMGAEPDMVDGASFQLFGIPLMAYGTIVLNGVMV